MRVLIDARGVLRLFRRLGGKNPSVRRGSRTISTGLGDGPRRTYDTCCHGVSKSGSPVAGAVGVEGWLLCTGLVVVEAAVVVVGVTGVVGLEGPQIRPLEPSISGERSVCRADVGRSIARLVCEGTWRPLTARSTPKSNC